MDLTAVAAVVGLTGIPVSLLVAQWQKRAALAQAAAAYRAALDSAETNHRAALDVVTKQAEADRERWLQEARRAVYPVFQNALGRFRRAITEGGDVRAAGNDIHDLVHEVGTLGPTEVTRLAHDISKRCTPITMQAEWRPLSPEEGREIAG
ncbi:hypothetical protein ACFV3E_25925 [Streptomyces sp. NPDC059718]